MKNNQFIWMQTAFKGHVLICIVFFWYISFHLKNVLFYTWTMQPIHLPVMLNENFVLHYWLPSLIKLFCSAVNPLGFPGETHTQNTWITQKLHAYRIDNSSWCTNHNKVASHWILSTTSYMNIRHQKCAKLSLVYMYIFPTAWHIHHSTF